MPSSSAFVAAMPSSRPLDRSLLELAPLLGEIAGAVRGDALAACRAVAVVVEAAARACCGDELGAAAAARERERLVPGAHEAGEQLGGLDVRRRARARVRVEQRPLPAREHALGAR